MQRFNPSIFSHAPDLERGLGRPVRDAGLHRDPARRPAAVHVQSTDWSWRRSYSQRQRPEGRTSRPHGKPEMDQRKELHRDFTGAWIETNRSGAVGSHGYFGGHWWWEIELTFPSEIFFCRKSKAELPHAVYTSVYYVYNAFYFQGF